MHYLKKLNLADVCVSLSEGTSWLFRESPKIILNKGCKWNLILEIVVLFLRSNLINHENFVMKISKRKFHDEFNLFSSKICKMYGVNEYFCYLLIKKMQWYIKLN